MCLHYWQFIQQIVILAGRHCFLTKATNHNVAMIARQSRSKHNPTSEGFQYCMLLFIWSIHSFGYKYNQWIYSRYVAGQTQFKEKTLKIGSYKCSVSLTILVTVTLFFISISRSHNVGWLVDRRWLVISSSFHRLLLNPTSPQVRDTFSTISVL